MTAPLTPLTVQRLAYVRYLYQEGIEQSRQPSLLSARAITSFHDAVENFIGLVAEQVGKEIKQKLDFSAYWEFLKPEIELPGKLPMKRLNDVRVALKHHGTFPSDHQIEQAREALVDFFTTVTPKVFGVDFHSVDMTDLVAQPNVAKLLRDAQTHADRGDYSMASAGLSLAFEALLTHYVGDTYRGRGPFSFGPNLQWSDTPKIGHREEPRNGRLDKLSQIAEAVQEAFRAVSLGIDYQGMARFQLTVPRVNGYGNGSQRYVETEAARALTAEDYAWAKHFVIESALRAAGADAAVHRSRLRDEALYPPGGHPQRTWTGPAEDPAE